MTLRAVLYDAKGDDREVDLDAEKTPKVDRDRLLWIDIDNRDLADLAKAAAAVGLESEGLRRLAREDRTARLLRLPDRVVLTLGTVDPKDAEAHRRELDIARRLGRRRRWLLLRRRDRRRRI